jgi:hypothetical protein
MKNYQNKEKARRTADRGKLAPENIFMGKNSCWKGEQLGG